MEPAHRPAWTGFTVIEMVVVIGILAVLAAVMVPLGAQLLESRREDATRESLVALREGILRPAGPGEGEGAGRAAFGYLGDMGALPDSLAQLLRRGGQPSFSLDPTHGLGAGWRGPYVDAGPGDPLRDAFGRPVLYEVRDSTVDGETWAGWLRSVGADGAVGTGDDLVVPLLAAEVRAAVTGHLVHGSGRPVSDAPLTYAFRRDGAVVDTLMSTDAAGSWSVPPHALGPVRAAAGGGSGGRLGHVRGSAHAFGPERNDLRFHMVDVDDRPVTLTSLTASWSGTTACYNDSRVNGTNVHPGGEICSGETLDFTTDITLPGGAAFAGSESDSRFLLDGPDRTAPELRIAGGRNRGEAVVELLDWEDAGTPVDLSGVTVSVAFSDGSATTFTVP